MNKITFLLFAYATTLLANPFQSALQNEVSWLKEETYIISASKTKETIKKTPASIYVITDEMIEKMGANNILDVLETVPGIGITQSNIFLKEIEVRGIKDWFSKQVLFMIDGHSLDANLVNGGATWSFDSMSLDNISRIEIIKGPASAIYGANAFTALVNIITKNANEINGAKIKTKFASFNTQEANLLYGKKYNDLSVVFNINIQKSDGDNHFVNQDVNNKSGYTNPYLKQLKTDLKLHYKDFQLNAMYSKREDGQYYGALGAINDETKTKNNYFFTELKHSVNLTKNLDITTRLYTDKYSFDNKWELKEGGNKMINGITNQKNGIESFTAYKLNNSYKMILGAMYEKHKQFDDTTIQNFDPVNFTALGSMTNFSGTQYSFPNISRDMWAGYINNLYDYSENLRFTFGARYDNYDDFDSNLASKIGLSWQINQNNTFKLMYGEGFRAPTFAELYNSNTVLNGNSTLKSERVRSYETSLSTQISQSLETKFTLFNNDYKDLIVQTGKIYTNAGKTNTRGIEFESKYNLNRGSYFMTNYTYQEAKDKLTNKDLPNIANHKGNVILNYRLARNVYTYNHLFIKGTTKRVSGDNRAKVSAFILLNSSIIIKNLYKNFVVKASINNLLNKTAYDPSNDGLTEDDYKRTGRNVALTLTYTF
ncbi:MAG: TonB-dependent receptor [Arcobacteraceae bacterium]